MTRFSLHQRLRYDYTSPIRRLQHRLVVLPPAVHGDQTRISHRLEVHGATAQTIGSTDRFGNVVVDVRARWVAEHVEFETWAVVDRDDRASRPMAVGHGRLLLAPTALTAPDAALRAAAATLVRSGDRGLALADRINDWAHGALHYRHGVTGVRTTASEALTVGEGVCQDYAHVMLSLCRLCGIPARYVSGHLQGEGGSHAWVEVLLPSPDQTVLDGGASDVGTLDVVAFDPTNHRRAGPTYLTIAVGRDYGDVAPTYGTYSGAASGTLTTFKELLVGTGGSGRLLARASTTRKLPDAPRSAWRRAPAGGTHTRRYGRPPLPGTAADMGWPRAPAE